MTEILQGDCLTKSRIIDGYRKRLATNGKWSDQDPQSSGRRIVENVKAARANGAPHDNPFGLKRNKRTVWTVATAPYSGAHFATFPPKLILPCILAGCPAGGRVLDPFGGTGTVGVVANSNGREATMIELNPAYCDLARERLGLFAPPVAKREAQSV